MRPAAYRPRRVGYAPSQDAQVCTVRARVAPVRFPYGGRASLDLAVILTSRDDPDAFRRLTGKTRHTAIARALRAMGVEHKVRADGVVVVSQAHVDKLLGAALPAGRKTKEPVLGPVK